MGGGGRESRLDGGQDGGGDLCSPTSVSSTCYCRRGPSLGERGAQTGSPSASAARPADGMPSRNERPPAREETAAGRLVGKAASVQHR